MTNLHHKKWLAFVALAGIGCLIPTGCQRQAPQNTSATDKDSHSDHSHQSPHGGSLISLGNDEYHADTFFEKDGLVKIWLLGPDASKVVETEVQTLNGFANRPGIKESIPVAFEPNPQAGDSQGKTSEFKAQLPEELVGKTVEITIPGLRIEKYRYRLAFSNAAAHSDPHAPMGEQLSTDEERELYFTPGGIYTQADIDFNGTQTAGQKFRGVMAAHDMSPVAGDLLCPITATKANSLFKWRINNEDYEFCCPPCIDEFVRMAKQTPEKVLSPSDYLK